MPTFSNPTAASMSAVAGAAKADAGASNKSSVLRKAIDQNLCVTVLPRPVNLVKCIPAELAGTNHPPFKQYPEAR
jgi:hypothetical protein